MGAAGGGDQAQTSRSWRSYSGYGEETVRRSRRTVKGVRAHTETKILKNKMKKPRNRSSTTQNRPFLVGVFFLPLEGMQITGE